MYYISIYVIYIYILLVCFSAKTWLINLSILHLEIYTKEMTSNRKFWMKKDVYYNAIYITLAQENVRTFWKFDYKTI